MEKSELLRRYASGHRDFSHIHLPNVDLSKTDLAGSGFQQANLAGANLAGAQLQNANLRQANLTGANLIGANLTGANLRRTILRQAIWDNAQLEGAILHGAILPDGSTVAADPNVLASPVPINLQADVPQADAPPINPSHSDTSPAESPLSPLSLEDPARTTAVAPSLPWSPLFFLGISYVCFGLLLGIHSAVPLLWAIALFSAMLWRIDPSLTLAIPLLAAIAVALADTQSLLAIWGLGWGGVVFATLTFVFKLILERTWLAALRDGAVVASVLVIAIKAYVWLLAAQGNYAWGPLAAPELTSAHLSMLLVLGVVCGGLGAIAWMKMLHLSRRHTTGIYLGTAAIGLLVGKLLTLVLTF